jgi:hypothetical protein
MANPTMVQAQDERLRTHYALVSLPKFALSDLTYPFITDRILKDQDDLRRSEIVRNNIKIRR